MSYVDDYYRNVKDLDKDQIRRREYFLKHIPKHGNILDLGCGPGRDAAYFTNKGYRVLGVDNSPEMIEFATLLAPNARFRTMDMTDWDLFEEFDGVWCDSAIFLIKKKQVKAVLENIAHVLTGILCINVKKGDSEGIYMDERYGVEKYLALYQEKELKKILQKSGFKIIKTEYSKGIPGYNKRERIIFFCLNQLDKAPQE